MTGKEKKRSQGTITPLSFPFYFIPILILAVIGLADSAYLAFSHYRVHSDISYSSFCALSRSLNCDTVSSSPNAVFLDIPIAIWGVIGFVAILFVLILAGWQKPDKKRFWPLLFWVSLTYSICSLILAGVSTFVINSYCIMCILVYLVNLSLLYYAWFINRRFGDLGLLYGLAADLRHLWAFKKAILPAAAIIATILGGSAFGLPEYWHVPPPPAVHSMSHGITENGHPWIGAENPKLIIKEYTDYLCTQCRIKHFFLRRLIAEHPNQIRLVHYHFPMDQKYNPLVKEPYHVGSGVLALFSLYAQEHDKFWEANDMFFQMGDSLGEIGSQAIAEKLNISARGLYKAPNNRYLLYKLRSDIKRGLDLGLTGTPGYEINGQVYQGYIPEQVLQNVLE